MTTGYRQLPELLTLQQACDSLAISRATMYRWIDTKRIKTIRYPESNKRLVRFDEVQRLLTEGEVDSPVTYETCASINEKGTRCQNRPMADLDVCVIHRSPAIVRGSAGATT